MSFITPMVLVIIYVALLLAAGGLSWAMLYHWNRYAFGPDGIAKAKKIYFTGLVALFAVALIFLIIYSIYY